MMEPSIQQPHEPVGLVLPSPPSSSAQGLGLLWRLNVEVTLLTCSVMKAMKQNMFFAPQLLKYLLRPDLLKVRSQSFNERLASLCDHLL